MVTGGEALREAALLGIGIAQSNGWTFKHDLAAGKVQPVLAAYAVEGRPLSIVYPPTRHVPNKLRVMIDFLVDITRVSPPAAGDADHPPAATARSVRTVANATAAPARGRKTRRPVFSG